MPYAQVLTTAAVANTGGGTFADNLAAQGTDSLAVANFNTGGARVLEAWAINSDHVGEIQWIYTRPEATHDQQHGFRFEIPAAALGGVATNAAFSVLPGYDVINLFKSDVATIQTTSTAADDVVLSYVTEYEDLPGASAVFASPEQIMAMHKSKVGIFVNAAGSGTPGAYGTARAFNADDDRLHANTWYAILGWTVRTQVTTISLIGPDWGGQRIGGPAGALFLNSSTWFQDQSQKWRKPLIPCFNSNNKGSVLVQVADAEASTTPSIDFNLVELTGMPGGGF
jgi:hypothetical protein